MNEKWRHLWTIPRKDKTLWHLVKKSNSWHQNDGIDELLLIFTMNRTSKVHVLKPIVLKKVSNETKNMVKEMGHRCVYLFLLQRQKRFSANWTRFEIQIISQIKFYKWNDDKCSKYVMTKFELIFELNLRWQRFKLKKITNQSM